MTVKKTRKVNGIRKWLRGIVRRTALVRVIWEGFIWRRDLAAETEWQEGVSDIEREKNVPAKKNNKWRGLRQEQATLVCSKGGGLAWVRSKSRQGPDHTGLCSMFGLFPN